MRDFLVSLPTGVRPRHGLETVLRSAIRSGQLRAGAPLPSTRAMASDLGIARSTVVAAYEQLAVEGYLHAEQGRATTVASVPILHDQAEDRNPLGNSPTHDFRLGEPAIGSFPRREWQRSMRRVLQESPDDVFGYGDPRGLHQLRDALVDYLSRTRAVHLDAAAVRVYSGFSSSLGFIGEMLRARDIGRIGVESPMLPFHRQILELVGVETVPIAVDADGLDVAQLRASDVRAVLVTPGNQQPLGVTMPSERRTALVRWALDVDGWVIEDDYDGEFRYDRRPIGALQGLDPERVLYAGTASKALGPGLHLSWLVVPQELRRTLATVTSLRAGVSTLNQLALADFIDNGSYDRHVRRQRRTYAHRRSSVHERLAPFDWLCVTPSQAGMHLVAMFAASATVDEGALVAQAAVRGVGLIGLQTHFDHVAPGLVINVSRPADHQFAAAVDALVDALACHRC